MTNQKKRIFTILKKFGSLKVLVWHYDLVIARVRVQYKLYFPSCKRAFKRVKYEEQQNMRHE